MSCDPTPFSWVRTRNPPRPRITGRLAAGENDVWEMPGRVPSVSPSDAAPWLSVSFWSVTETDVKPGSPEATGLADWTTISGNSVCASTDKVELVRSATETALHFVFLNTTAPHTSNCE